MNDNVLLLLALFLAQNRRLMEDLRPALDFLETHKDAVELLSRTFSSRTSADLSDGERKNNGEKSDGHARENRENRTTSADGAQEKPTARADEKDRPKESAAQGESDEKKGSPAKEDRTSPLQGIANREILESILSYMNR